MKKVLIIFLMTSVFASAYSQCILKEKMPLTYSKIAARAEAEWPADFEMQKYTIDKQCNAFVEYVGLRDVYNDIPKETFSLISVNALIEWSAGNIEDCMAIVADIDTKTACQDSDWEMVVYEIKKQADAYRELH